MSGTTTSDHRIEWVKPLPSPALLRDQLPLTEAAAQTVLAGRQAVRDVLAGDDDRLMVIVGPCSIHDPAAALDYATRLSHLARTLADDLLVVLRAYFEKPRTMLGWKGLILDPGLDGSGEVSRGLAAARRFLLDVVDLGLPAGCEWLDPIVPQYIADAVSWGAIGARTVESQIHRQLASGMSMPVGIKNRRDGDLRTAVEALVAASVPHVFVGVTEHGVPAIHGTTGNPDCHLVLRGGGGRTNYGPESVATAVAALADAKLPLRVMIDASHDNSAKDHRNQPAVAATVAEQVAAGDRRIRGLMLESFLFDGRQDLQPGRPLTYGRSITDACIDWNTTEQVLHLVASAARTRRTAAAAPATA